MMTVRKSLRVAYVIQNAGNDLAQDVGQAILIKQTVRGLEEAGHSVSLFRLQGRQVVRMDDVFNLANTRPALLGMSGARSFKAVESGVRRVQRELRLPYLALFDAYRFYEASYRYLPEFTICHEYGGLFSIGAALACRRQRIPHVLTVEADPFLENRVKGTPLRGPKAIVAAAAAGIAYRLAGRIITVSVQAKNHLVENWRIRPEKVAVLPNGVDIDRWQPKGNLGQMRQQLGLNGAPVVGFVGSFQRWHGTEGLVASFAQVVQRLPHSKLLLIGDGPARPFIEQQITELGLESKVIVTGLVPHTSVPDTLALIDVAVLPYPKLPAELWFSPLKLYEYMAAGKAIVASNAGQIAETIEHLSNGILVESGDVTALTQAIIRLLENPEERVRLGKCARQQAIERHSWKHYTEQLEQIYMSVL